MNTVIHRNRQTGPVLVSEMEQSEYNLESKLHKLLDSYTLPFWQIVTQPCAASVVAPERKGDEHRRLPWPYQQLGNAVDARVKANTRVLINCHRRDLFRKSLEDVLIYIIRLYNDCESYQTFSTHLDWIVSVHGFLLWQLLLQQDRKALLLLGDARCPTCQNHVVGVHHFVHPQSATWMQCDVHLVYHSFMCINHGSQHL